MAKRAFLQAVDFLNDRSGKVFSILYLPLMVIVVIEVVLRYFFNRPTIWAWDVNIQLFAFLIVFGAGYTLLKGGHVRMDVFVVRLSPRKRALIDLLMSFIFFICIGALFWQSCDQASQSIQSSERFATIWAPPIYPLRIAIPIGVMLFLLQGVAKFIRDIDILRAKRGDQP